MLLQKLLPVERASPDISLFVGSSVCLFVCLPRYPCICLCPSLSVYLSLFTSRSLYLSPYMCVRVCLACIGDGDLQSHNFDSEAGPCGCTSTKACAASVCRHLVFVAWQSGVMLEVGKDDRSVEHEKL